MGGGVPLVPLPEGSYSHYRPRRASSWPRQMHPRVNSRALSSSPPVTPQPPALDPSAIRQVFPECYEPSPVLDPVWVQEDMARPLPSGSSQSSWRFSTHMHTCTENPSTRLHVLPEGEVAWSHRDCSGDKDGGPGREESSAGQGRSTFWSNSREDGEGNSGCGPHSYREGRRGEGNHGEGVPSVRLRPGGPRVRARESF